MFTIIIKKFKQVLTFIHGSCSSIGLGAGTGQHLPAGLVPLRGPIDQYHGHNFPERMTQSGSRRNHFSDVGGSAMPFSDPQPSGQDLTLAAVNTRRQGLGAAYPPAPGSSSTIQSSHIMNQQRPRRTSNSNHFGGFEMKIDPLRRPVQCPQTCDLTAWPKCQCVSPATYSDDGRGNCNVGAMKIDLQVVQELFCKSQVIPAFIYLHRCGAMLTQVLAIHYW